MGTPGHPEGVPHFSNKAMMGKWWKARVAKQKPFHLFFKCTCGECPGEMVVENVLAGVTAVKVECDYGFFRPDILLERGGGQKPVFVEVTHTSGPSQNKLEFCYKEGVDVFELDGSGRPGTRHDTIRNVHVARGNCRKPKRERLLDLWRHMESLEWARVGVKEDFRIPERKQSEIEAQLAHFEEQDALFDSGTLHCARCSKPIGRNKDGSVHRMSIYTHKEDGDCGYADFCAECDLEVVKSMQVGSPDGFEWGLDDECPTCRPIIEEQERQTAKLQSRHTVWMPEPYGSRVVQEPYLHTQSYIVGERSVSRDELLNVLVLFEVLARLPENSKNPMGQRMVEDVRAVIHQVHYANGILDWDWLEGIGESYVENNHDSPNALPQNRFFIPKRWVAELPAFPLDIPF